MVVFNISSRPRNQQLYRVCFEPQVSSVVFLVDAILFCFWLIESQIKYTSGTIPHVMFIEYVDYCPTCHVDECSSLSTTGSMLSVFTCTSRSNYEAFLRECSGKISQKIAKACIQCTNTIELARLSISVRLSNSQHFHNIGFVLRKHSFTHAEKCLAYQSTLCGRCYSSFHFS